MIHPDWFTRLTNDPEEYPVIIANQKWERDVPKRYRFADVQTLTPNAELSKMPPERQQRVIDILRLRPNAGYAFLGPSGWSKTTFMYALYRYAIETNIADIMRTRKGEHRIDPVVFVDVADLINQIQSWRVPKDEFTPQPVISAERINRLAAMGIKAHIFLDEFEKVKKSEFRMRETYDLLNAAYKHESQLVIAGNFTKADLDDRNQYLEGTPRRIEELTTPHFWEWK